MTERRDDPKDEHLPAEHRRAPSSVPTDPGSAPFRNQLSLPEADPSFVGEMRREVRESAQSRLEALDKVYRSLQEEARGVVGAAKRDLQLHQVRIYGTRLRGRTYYLYRRPPEGGDATTSSEDSERRASAHTDAPGGELFMSLLEPEEWAEMAPGVEHLGTYHLNHDASWTRMDQDDAEDKLAYADEPEAPREGEG